MKDVQGTVNDVLRHLTSLWLFSSLFIIQPTSHAPDFSIAENSGELRQSLLAYKLSLNAYVRGGCFLCSHSCSQGQRRVYITDLLPWQQTDPRSREKRRVHTVGVREPRKNELKQSKTGPVQLHYATENKS